MLNSVFSSKSSRWLGAATLLSLSSLSAQGQYDPEWTRNFRAGLLTGFNIKGDFRVSGGAIGLSGSADNGNGYRFDDGYVLRDNTGNAGGVTTHWGYQDSSQHQGQQLVFTRSESFSANQLSVSGEDESPYLGLDLAYGGVLWRGERMRIGWELGFGLLPITLSDNSDITVQVEQRSYRFDIPNGVVIPGAPYNGSASGFDQPVIESEPDFVSESSPSPGQLTGTRELDAMLYAFKLGPTLFWDLHPSFGLALSAGPAVGFVTGEYKFDERLNDTENRGSFSDTHLIFGGYVNATVTYHAMLNGDFYLSAQYMPLGSAEFSKGGRSAKLDLSGALYLSGGINWPF